MALIRQAICRDGRAILRRNTVGFDERAHAEYGAGDGSPDLMGMICAGTHRGRAFHLEVKRPDKDTTSARRKKMQAAWATAERSRGAFVATVRSVEEAMAALERAMRGESQ